MQNEVREIAVVGAGTMGAGIAQLAAAAGCRVHLVEIHPEVRARSMAGIERQFDRAVEKQRMTVADRDAALARILPRAEIGRLDESQLAIEAVVEDMAIKHRVFAALEGALPGDAVLATNTSSLSVTQIARSVTDASRVVGMHFFNPAPVMPLVEIIATEMSRKTFVDLAFAVAQTWGKTPVHAKDTPGFIVNRVARGYYLEALRLLGEGVAGVDEIDLVMRRHGGFRMGPFELMDLVGLDVNYAVSTSVWEQFGRPARLAPHEIQANLVREGCLGRKTGRGFYDYGQDNPLPTLRVDRGSFSWNPELAEACATFARAAGAPDATPTEQYVLGRILGAILNEAALAFDERVATAADIDVAMKLGTNYPRGPLEWAEEIRYGRVRKLLRELDRAVGDGRYAPARLYEGGTRQSDGL